MAIIRNALSSNNTNDDKRSITDNGCEEVIDYYDNEPVTPRELKAWYLQNMAIEPYGVAAISILTPLILESYASQTGFKASDINIPCDVTEPNYNCITKFGSGYVNTESYSFYVLAISVVLQAFVFISCGALADYGTVNVFLLAYIPVYSRLLPNVIEARNDPNKGYHEVETLIEYNGNKLSTNAIGTGVATGIILLAICAAIAGLMDASILSLKIGCLIIGAWCLFLSTFPLLWLKNRSGPPLPSDGLNTISSVAVIFGKKVFNLSFAELLTGALLVPLMAIIGAYLFLFMQQKLSLSTKTMVLIVCGLEALLPIYGLFGFFAPFGLKEKWEIWLSVVFFGLMLGAAQSFYRVLFASLIPKGHENEFFSLYEITDKGSSWIGTLLTGVINDLTGNLRYTYFVLTIMLVLPLLLIATVDVEKGKIDAENFSKREYSKEIKIDNKDDNDNTLDIDIKNNNLNYCK
ncbi:7264_t:CDS:2 [Entrophospora sp. SA101]|nr:4591_t:CDS:2 [Entrophospora sp. SA101]CAJ0751164.1 14776_t:CDS:2 [Entrophospora sp. SA101]CAJ0755578.1 7264_t:CDS:2 [Entrophospora sp. SA101]